MLDSWEFSGESGHVRIHVCVTAVWSAGPVRIYLVILLEWVAGRYGSFVLLALFWRVCLIEQVGGVAGQYNFSSIICSCFGGYGTIEMAGYAVFKISLSSVCC